MTPPEGAYARAGVDIDAARRTKELIKGLGASTYRPGVLKGIGLFGSSFELKGFKNPVLVSSVDGVGTKLKIASLLGRNDTVGADLVNHCVNDILCCGADPLFFLDYVAMGKLVPEQVAALVGGIAQACKEVGCALVGGETAEMPGIYTPPLYDLVGFITGVVEKNRMIDGRSIAPGDLVLGIPSNGLHTNGYSLVRRVFNIDNEPSVLQQHSQELGRTLGDELLRTHRCYYPVLKPALAKVKGLAHITGGGIKENLPRILPEGLAARIDGKSWQVPAIFRLIQAQGNIKQDEMYRVFNMGIGMTAICAARDTSAVARLIPHSKVIGEIAEASNAEAVVIY